ncbi:hypothetical protein ACFQDF_09355 [Ectobacillus funiculus]
MMTQMTDVHIHILQTFFYHTDSLDPMQGIVSDWSSYSALENVSKGFFLKTYFHLFTMGLQLGSLTVIDGTTLRSSLINICII